MQGGLQIGLTKGQAVSRVQWSLVRPLGLEGQAYPPICKELVERDLDRTLSTYIKYQENPDSAERCPSEAQRSCEYADTIWKLSQALISPEHHTTFLYGLEGIVII